MEMPLNKQKPLVMYVDFDSCFATIEQQAWFSARGRPLVVAAYDEAYGCVLSPSREAKKLGIKVGMRVKEAKQIYPKLIVKTPDPKKYRVVHEKFIDLLQNYSPEVSSKSIDEAVLRFSSIEHLLKRSLIDIALEIKERIKKEIGDWISCSVGIAPNQFLAKTASALHKPDGLDIITHQNVRAVLQTLKLIDLCGINVRYERRLNAQGIYTPVEFLDASLQKLERQVFKSVYGHYWYLRLRGFEIDNVEFTRRSYGQSYSLSRQKDTPENLQKILMKLCEKMGRRLRHSNHFAYGIHLSCSYVDGTYWHKGTSTLSPLFVTRDLYLAAKKIFLEQPERKGMAILAVSCFNLKPRDFAQLELFESEFSKKLRVSQAVDEINDRFGEYIVKPALMINSDDVVVDRIAFGK